VIHAVTALSANGTVDPVLVLDSGVARISGAIPSHIEVIDTVTDARRERVLAHLLSSRGHRGLSADRAAAEVIVEMFG